MFKISMIVDAKKLAPALVALDGMGYNLEVVPVKNAEPAKARKVRQVAEGTGISKVRAFVGRLMDQGLRTTSTAELAESADLTSTQSGFIIRSLMKDGLITRTARGQFNIN